MKKVIALVLIVAFFSACSQYTCPTYSKREQPKKTAPADHKI